MALELTHQHFKNADRGKLIMACGTGKTFNSLRMAENETKGKGLVLFLVPSIALLGQTLREWSADANEPIIYYLHGALFLYKETEMTIKIRRASRTEELLDLIRLRIHLGNFPIFVSEGRASLKEETISRNKYLSFCRSAFRDSEDRLVIYGFSFSDSDNHRISDLNWNRRKLAIGLHLSGLNDGKILQKVRHIEKKLYKYPSREIKYFDSKSLF